MVLNVQGQDPEETLSGTVAAVPHTTPLQPRASQVLGELGGTWLSRALTLL